MLYRRSTERSIGRYYLQIITFAAQNFVPLLPSQVRAVPNGDLVIGLPAAGDLKAQGVLRSERTGTTPGPAG